VLDVVLEALRCPVCAHPLRRDPDRAQSAPRAGRLWCDAGHAFDIARQGYVNLLTGRAPAGAETPAMVAARRGLFDAGHLAPLTRAIVAEVPTDAGLVLDAGAGTGHHLAAVLDARAGSAGVALDVSKAAARHNARAHPRLGSVVADVWRRLPLADACADAILDVFAPRHGAEFHRVLREGGTLVVVTPAQDHLAELVGPLELVTVDPAKADRVQESLGRWFATVRTRTCRYGLAVTREDAARFVAMGPSAWHTTPAELVTGLASWPEPVSLTVSVIVTTYMSRLISSQPRGGSW
jgi:23S rRNA (guanine745-N1)-methyltransferase